MKIRKLSHAILAAELHGLDRDPDHEVGDLQDMLRIVWAALPKPARRRALRRLQAYVDESCGVEGYENDFNPEDHVNHHAHKGG